jgi:hypothetical protein
MGSSCKKLGRQVVSYSADQRAIYLVPIQKLLRTSLTAPTVLTAPRLLRSVVTAIEVPRYVSGWELRFRKCKTTV